MKPVLTLPDLLCSNEDHGDSAPEAASLITLPVLGDAHGYPVCDRCLLSYVDFSYAQGARLPFAVRPL